MGVQPRAVFLLGGILLSACAEEPALRVGDVSFSASRLRGLSEPQLDRLAMITAVGVATARGEHASMGAPIVGRWAEDRRIKRLREELALTRAGVDEGTLRARYAEDPEPELLVRHLVILSERWRSADHRSEARARAAQALQRTRSGEPFPILAGKVSEEPGAEARGGLLGAGRAGTWVREFWEAAAALDVGEVSEVIETEYGFHVLKLEERRVVPFEEARPRLVARVAAEADDAAAWDAQISDWIEGMEMNRVPGPEVTREEMGRRVALEEADRRGLTLTAGETDPIEREWAATAARWGAALGFVEGMAAEQIADQALVALGLTGQSSRIAREEIARWGDILLAAYPVSRPAR